MSIPLSSLGPRGLRPRRGTQRSWVADGSAGHREVAGPLRHPTAALAAGPPSAASALRASTSGSALGVPRSRSGSLGEGSRGRRPREGPRLLRPALHGLVGRGGRVTRCPARWLTYLPLVLLMAGCNNPQAKRRALEQLMIQELPSGSTASHVIAFLDSNRIVHYGYDAKERVIHARAELGGTIVQQALHIVFRFNGDGKLVRQEFEEWATGP